MSDRSRGTTEPIRFLRESAGWTQGRLGRVARLASRTLGTHPSENSREEFALTMERDDLVARWRRLDRYLATVAAGQNDPGHAVPDAIAPALDEIYGLWEAWTDDAGLSFRQEDPRVAGDLGGETTAALVFARGARHHGMWRLVCA